MKVVVSKTLKNIVKMQYKDDALYVTANIFVTRKRIRRLIEENSDWINSKRMTVEKRQHVETESRQATCKNTSFCDKSFDEQQLIKEIFAGRKTLILGETVSVEPCASSKTYLDGSILYVAEKNFVDRDLRIKAIKSYLKKIAFLFVASEVSSFGSNVSLCPQKIEFKEVDDGWCKCSLASQKILCFDYRLTQLPQNLRNYVIAHAFAHFRFASHDDAFWNHISNVVPRYKDLEKQLEACSFLKDV